MDMRVKNEMSAVHVLNVCHLPLNYWVNVRKTVLPEVESVKSLTFLHPVMSGVPLL